MKVISIPVVIFKKIVGLILSIIRLLLRILKLITFIILLTIDLNLAGELKYLLALPSGFLTPEIYLCPLIDLVKGKMDKNSVKKAWEKEKERVEKLIMSSAKDSIIVPSDNGAQPNLIFKFYEAKDRQKAENFLKKLKNQREEGVNWGDTLSIVKFLTKKVHEIELDLSFGSIILDLITPHAVKEIREINKNDKFYRHIATSTTIFEIPYPACFERSIFLSSLLDILNIENRIIFLAQENNKGKLRKRHAVVWAKIGNVGYILDPENDIVEQGLYKYLNRFYNENHFFFNTFGNSKVWLMLGISIDKYISDALVDAIQHSASRNAGKKNPFSIVEDPKYADTYFKKDRGIKWYRIPLHHLW